jgi:nucleoid-associated protein YgaU
LAPLAAVATVTVVALAAGCSSTAFDSGDYDYNYDSPRAVAAPQPLPAVTEPPPPLAPPIASPVVEASIPEGEAPLAARVVRLVAGDTLFSLSARYLGHGRRWREIAQLNGISDFAASRLPIGKAIQIPAR